MRGCVGKGAVEMNERESGGDKRAGRRRVREDGGGADEMREGGGLKWAEVVRRRVYPWAATLGRERESSAEKCEDAGGQ